MFKESRGFTLIELLVVIAIIGLLSSVILASLSSAKSKARDTSRIAGIKQLMVALDMFHTQNGHYPYSTNCRSSSVPNNNWCNSHHSKYGNQRWISDNGVLNILADYINAEPVDPTPRVPTTLDWTALPGVYYYYAPNNATFKDTYLIIFRLENAGNPIEKLDGVYDCMGVKWEYSNALSNGIITLGANCPR